MEISRKSGSPGVIAHRCLGLGAAENSWEAFRRLVTATRRGCRLSVEFDVRCTADDALVIFHDEDIAGHLIADLTYAELRNLTGFHSPPLLSELVDQLAGIDIPLIDVELKVIDGIDQALSILEALRTQPMLIQSFSSEVIEYVADHAPYFETALLLDPLKERQSTTEARMAEFFRLGADVLNVEVSQVTPELSRAVRAHGKRLGVYTLNDSATMIEWARAGLVDWIITDVPRVLVPELAMLDLGAKKVAT